MSLQFELPPNLTADKLIAKLSSQIDLQPVSRDYSLKTYYDSFDWRLYEKGIVCEFVQSKTASLITLKNLEDDLIIAATELEEVPPFSKQFQPGKLRSTLEPILEMRALLSICTLEYEVYQVNVINKDEKTVLRLTIEDYELFNSRVLLHPIKGYDKYIEQITDLFTGLEVTPPDQPLLLAALKLQGRKPKEYSSKLNINLDPDMRADIASKYIYSHLLNTIKANEQGTINDTDSEFLHDFRVAVRRTRSGLSQVKGVLPDAIQSRFADFFYWLGQITGPTRDLDVYLLNFEQYKNCLPISIREDLNPLYEFLVAKQQKAQKELAKKLRSAKYLSILSEWEHYLKEQAPAKPVEANANLTIKQLADRRIWKIFNRVLQEGDAITPYSPAETLHELRKTCKKLRYLMEFFQNLYSEQQIKHLIKSLKGLQEVLGEFQDLQVQENNLKVFSKEMLANNIPANTFLAMGVLIQNLDAARGNARNNFTARFSAFKQTENRMAFKALFVAKG
jgi:CHAD domain-containing protein